MCIVSLVVLVLNKEMERKQRKELVEYEKKQKRKHGLEILHVGDVNKMLG